MKGIIRSEGIPVDRLSRIADAMTDTMQSHEEHLPQDRCVVFLTDEVNSMSGVVMSGYNTADPDTEAIADVLMSLRAIFRANGKDLQLLAIPDSPGDLG